MGGYGSGQRGGRVSVEGTASLRLSVHSLIRGRLRAGNLSRAKITFESSYDGEWPVDVLVDTRCQFDPFLELSHEPRNGDDDTVRYRIGLETTKPHFGGERWWFRCPYTRRRCGVLYLPLGGRHFASRRAYGMVYECQKETRSDRRLRRARKLNYALGGNGDETPDRPKGMWQRTYERRLARLEAAEDRAEDAWLVSVAPLFRRLGVGI